MGCGQSLLLTKQVATVLILVVACRTTYPGAIPSKHDPSLRLANRKGATAKHQQTELWPAKRYMRVRFPASTTALSSTGELQGRYCGASTKPYYILWEATSTTPRAWRTDISMTKYTPQQSSQQVVSKTPHRAANGTRPHEPHQLFCVFPNPLNLTSNHLIGYEIQ